MTKLVIGLGNPGKDYEKTRHNVGFFIIDEYAKRHGVKISRKKFKGAFGEAVDREGNKVVLLKPQTFMNLSGECVQPWVHFLKISGKDILLVHDEIDLPLGRFKAQWAAGAAGHRGVESIFEKLGNKELCRLRVGVGHPGSQDHVVGHVLSGFSKEERKKLPLMIEQGAEAVEVFLEKGLDPLAQLVNRRA